MKPGLALSIIMSPWLLVLGYYMFLAGACRDDFCTGFLWEAAITIVVLAALVATLSWFLLRRGRGVGRAGISAWSAAVGVAAIVFAMSQLLEADVFPAAMSFVVALALFGFAWAASRLPRAGDPFAPRNAL